MSTGILTVEKGNMCEMDEDEECCVGFELELSLCTHQFKKTCISQLCPLKGSKSNDTSGIEYTWHTDLGFKMPLPTKRLLLEMVDFRSGTEFKKTR